MNEINSLVAQTLTGGLVFCSLGVLPKIQKSKTFALTLVVFAGYGLGSTMWALSALWIKVAL